MPVKEERERAGEKAAAAMLSSVTAAFSPALSGSSIDTLEEVPSP